jgi:hypothetical protein
MADFPTLARRTAPSHDRMTALVGGLTDEQAMLVIRRRVVAGAVLTWAARPRSSACSSQPG